MKKIFLLAAAALLIGSAANAQDVFKQQGGEQNIEVQFAPLGGSPIGIEGIRYRKFTSATRAIRAEVFLGFQSSTDISLGGSEGETELKMGESAFDISISAGIENHWAGTDRLSPYWGYVGSIGFGSDRMTQEYITNADDDIEKLVETSQGSLTIGVAGVIGVDYYFADNIYVGTEVAFGIQYM
ncbi:MAG: BT1926 family outer membrane beta-barrel protein, partial [Cryomorphaceae bacterium]